MVDAHSEPLSGCLRVTRLVRLVLRRGDLERRRAAARARRPHDPRLGGRRAGRYDDAQGHNSIEQILALVLASVRPK